MTVLSPRLFVPLVVLAAAASACGRDPDLNVILVTLDTTRADFLGSYGHPDAPTPNFDAVAERGTRFDLAICTAAVTPVSHASILTGMNNAEHGLRVLSARSGYRLPGQVPTLATVLHEHAYRTAAIHSAFPVSSYFGLDRGFDLFDSVEAELVPGSDDASGQTSWDVDRYQRRSDETTERVLTFLAQVREPFFLWIHYWDPHDGKRKPPADYLPSDRPRLRGSQAQRALYTAEVRYMDSQFGRVLAALRADGRDQNTMLVIVSDHGQGLGDHDWPTHRILYQEQIRVPLIISVPGHEQTQTLSDLTRATDIFPTVLDYLGIEPPERVSGQSLRGLMEGRSEPERIAFADQINLFDLNATMVAERPNDDFLYCAMDRSWKLTYRPTHPELSELYLLTDDPAEEHNLFHERPEQVLRLMKELALHDPWVTEPFAAPEDPDDQEAAALRALAALGYASDGADGPRGALTWTWVCPNQDHSDEVGERGARCRVCGAPPIPVGRAR